MVWWQVLITITGVNVFSFIVLIWKFRGWFEVTQRNKIDVDELKADVSELKNKDHRVQIEMQEVRHEISTIKQDLKYQLEALNVGQNNITHTLREIKDENVAHRHDIEGGRERTMETLRGIKEVIVTQCELSTQALAASGLSSKG